MLAQCAQCQQTLVNPSGFGLIFFLRINDGRIERPVVGNGYFVCNQCFYGKTANKDRMPKVLRMDVDLGGSFAYQAALGLSEKGGVSSEHVMQNGPVMYLAKNTVQVRFANIYEAVLQTPQGAVLRKVA